jgi:HAD superfamily hydrolase (TIGR01509 family)
MKYQAVIFDIDGTLLDSVDQHAEAWRLVFEQHGKRIPFPEVRGQIGKGGDQLLPVFFTPEEIADFGETMEAERARLFQRDFLPRVRPFPGVRALFERMKRDGLQLALASSAKKSELKHYARLLEIEDLIEAGTSSDDAEKSKPHPDIFDAAVKKLAGIAPGATLVIGDTPYDAEAAAKIGIETIGLLCGGFAESDLRAAGVIALYQDPADLLRRYENSPLAAR